MTSEFPNGSDKTTENSDLIKTDLTEARKLNKDYRTWEQILDLKGAVGYLQAKVDAGFEKTFEYGTQPESIEMGKRNDLKELMVDIKSGMSIDDIKDKYPGQYLRMKKAITDEVNEHYVATKPKKFAPLLTTYMYGDSDTNKTRYALEMAQEDYEDSDIFEFTMPDSGKVWWDGYNNQKCVIINGFKAQFGVEYFNNLLDGKITTVEVKGGFKIANFERLYITSIYKWSELWAKTFAKNKELGRAVYRRLDEIIKFEKGVDPVYEKYCPRRVDDGLSLPKHPTEETDVKMSNIDFVQSNNSRKRKFSEISSFNKKNKNK